MRKTLLTIAAAACIAGGLTISAEAMPLSVAGTASTANAAHLILVRQGCGGGFHRNWRGRCVPNPRVRRYYRRHWRRYRHCYTRWTYYGRRRVCRYY
jgi:hypothetical protein